MLEWLKKLFGGKEDVKDEVAAETTETPSEANEIKEETPSNEGMNQ